MEDRTGGVLLPSSAAADWPRMDPPNVLWFFGTFATAFGVSFLVSNVSDAENGLWRFLVALAFTVAFAAAAWGLLMLRWWVPGGLAAWLAVASFPGVAIGFLELIEVWPDDPLFEPVDEFSVYPVGVAIATAAVGVFAFAVTRFTFILAIVVGAALIAAQLCAPAFEEGPSTEDRAAIAIVAGALVVIVGVFLDAFGRRRDAFWFHVLGWFSVGAGVTVFASGAAGDSERGWVPLLIVGILMLVAAGPMGRASWAVYGVLAFYGAIVHYLRDALDDDGWAFGAWLVVIGLAIFLQGMLLHRYGQAWAQRFVRRPPPDVH